MAEWGLTPASAANASTPGRFALAVRQPTFDDYSTKRSIKKPSILIDNIVGFNQQFR
jgi:hypothetical protein